MAVLTEEKLLTADEYYETCFLDRTELIDGKVVEMVPPSELHADLAATLCSKLRSFVRRHDLGRVYVELSCTFSPSGFVRVPDVCFIQKSRLDPARNRSKGFDGAPDLAVEIVSPSDRWNDVEDKIRLFLQSGTRVVWIIEPENQAVTIRTRTTNAMIFEDDILSGGEILPGFEMPAAELFEDDS